MAKPVEEMALDELRAEVECLRTMRQLVRHALKPSLDTANAFGGEMRLAIAVRDILDESYAIAIERCGRREHA